MIHRVTNRGGLFYLIHLNSGALINEGCILIRPECEIAYFG
jgi:hypothetical protein